MDEKLPWDKVVKGDLVVVDNKWWRIVSITTVHAGWYEISLVDFEGGEMNYGASPGIDIARVRMVGPDPWQGRRKEGHFD